MKERIFFVIVVLLYLTAVNAQPDIRVVQVKGRATILNNDVIAARDEALIDARVKALESLGIHVDSKAIISQSSLIDQTVVNKTNGFIRTYRILNEFKESGIYQVEIEAWISSEISEEDLKKYLRNFTVVVGIETKIDNKRIDDTRIEDAIISELVDNGFDVIDKEQLLALKNTSLYNQAVRGNSDAARAIGRRLLANLIVVGTAKTKESEIKNITTYDNSPGQIVCYRSHFSIRIIETETGSIIGMYKTPFKGTKGFGRNKLKAADDAFDNGMPKVGEKLLDDLSGYSKNKTRNVVIEINNIPDINAYRLIKRLIGSQRWVEGLEEKGFSSSGSSSFSLRYSEKIGILAAALQRIKHLEVESSSRSRICLIYKN